MPDSIPVIIEKELFDSVQDKIAKNRRAPARHKAEDDYLLTTKLFCGMCGAMMFGECGTGRNKVVHHYYKCSTAKRFKTCKKKTVRKEWLEDLVVNETMKMIRDDDSIQSIVDAVMILQEQENTVLPLLEKQMKDIENGIENLLNAIQAGVLTSSTKGRLEKLEAQQKELEIRIAEEKLAKPKVSADFVKFWLTNFRKLDPNVKSHRETLINTFVNAVYLYDEKVLITFNYKDGTKTITFDEIAAKDAPEGNGSDLDCFAPPRKRLCRNTQAFFLCNPAAAIDAGGFEQHRPAEQSGGQKGPCGAFLDARLANPQLSHNCLVSPNGDDRVELFVICSFPIGHAGGFEPKNRGTPHAGHASVFLMFLFCYLTLPCAPAAAGTNRTRCSARRPPAWKWGPPGRSWSGWRSAGCS